MDELLRVRRLIDQATMESATKRPDWEVVHGDEDDALKLVARMCAARHPDAVQAAAELVAFLDATDGDPRY